MTTPRSTLRTHTRHRGLRRLGTALLTAAAIGAVTAQAAEAHVRVKADTTTSGAYSALTFRVPNESPTAGTVAVAVTLPQDTPFTSVSTKPVPGWTATTAEQPLPSPVTIGGATITKAVRTVTWKADAGIQIAPGQYQEFSISVGPLPAPTTLVLPTTQTYSDGTVVAWDQPSPAGGPEPEKPAPSFTVVAAAATAPTSASSDSDPVARGLAAAALVVALLGAGVALRRRRGTVSP